MYKYEIGLIFLQETINFYGIFNPMNTSQLKNISINSNMYIIDNKAG
jgi:hypothetical protein